MDTETLTGPQLTTSEFSNIVKYCAEEVRRQGRTPTEVGGMVEAWMDAIQHQYHGDVITAGMIRHWGHLIEPKLNYSGYRTEPLFIGNVYKGYVSVGVAPEVIDDRMNLFVEQYEEMTALDAYRAFEGIHPFWDGNGRTGKIILNWINGTLINPIFPPKDFWGEEIDNP